MASKYVSVSSAVLALAIAACGGPSQVDGIEARSERLGPELKISIDGDEFFKGLRGATAMRKLVADTQAVATRLMAATAASTGAVRRRGSTELLYTGDGWKPFTLMALGGNAEIWVANDLSFCPGDPRPTPVVTQAQVDYMLNQLNETIYPSNLKYFGALKDRDGTRGLFASLGYDWYKTDNPQRVMALVYNIVDRSFCDPDYPFRIAGYFWPHGNDELSDRNAIYIDAADWHRLLGARAERPHLYEQVFTHELEHAIHFDRDPNEVSWIDEGLADLAPFLAGYGHAVGHIQYYLAWHRTSLTTWNGQLADYGASYLFQLYLMENFGGPAFTRALVNDPATGIAGVNSQLAAFGHRADFDAVYRDWTLANLIDRPGITGRSGAKLGYESLAIPADTEGVSIAWGLAHVYGTTDGAQPPWPQQDRIGRSAEVRHAVDQLPAYAPAYFSIEGERSTVRATFEGDATVGVPAHGGRYQLWGGRANDVFHTATSARSVALGADAKLSFWTVYEIEQGFDFAFVQVSTDRGKSWTSLGNNETRQAHADGAAPHIVDNLPGFTGSSDGWRLQEIDLSAYAGQTVRVRFAYATDSYTTERGFSVDDVKIVDRTGVLLSDDVESDVGWTLAGFEWTTGLTDTAWALTFVNAVDDDAVAPRARTIEARPTPDGGLVKLSTTLTTAADPGISAIVVSHRLPENVDRDADFELRLRER